MGAVPIVIVNRFFGILALFAIATVVLLVLLLATRRVPHWLRDLALPLAAAIAFVTTLGSLYYSEIAGYPPCTLCWYQRIAIYPQTIVLGVAALRRDTRVWLTSVPLAVAGILLSLWHVIIERVPSLAGPCESSNPCAIKWVAEFGLLTIPTMALVAGLSFVVLSLAAAATDRPGGQEGHASR